MKKATTFLFLFSLVCSLNAQTITNFKEKKATQDSRNIQIELAQKHIQRVLQLNQLYSYQLKTQNASIKLDSIVGNYADTAGAVLEKEFKYDFMYDANGNPISEYQSYWDMNQWLYDSRIQNTFNSSGQLLTEIYAYWNTNVWENDYKYTYVWGANGMISQETDYEWNGSQWENAYKYNYTYDANENLIEEMESEWNNGAWEETDKNTYTYNANNQITQELDYSWDGSQWVNDWKRDYTYDNNNFLILVENYNWNGTWHNSWKEEYTNDANGRPIEIIEFSWMGNYWAISGKNELTYDANGNATQGIYSSWYGGAYHLSQKEEFTFDLSFGPSDMWLPLWFDEFHNKVVDASFYEYDNGNWEISQSINLYYSAIPFGVDETSLNSIQLYPNPTQGRLFLKGNVVKGTSVSVSDITGKVLLANCPAYSNQMLDFSNLPAGIYFVKIVDGKKAIVKKVVKQ